MLFSILIVSISLLLEALLSSYIPILVSSNNFFIPMFTIVSIVIIYPYFNETSKYLRICAIFGLIYDILFTNTLGLNIFLFVSIGFIITFLDSILSNTLISTIVKMLVGIIIYDAISYLILILLNYINYDILTLLLKIVKSLSLNIIYTIILYYVVDIIARKFNIKRNN